MTDTRRALLWGVFSVSLVMLWDGWNKHNGHPSMFSPPVAASAAAGASAPGVPSAAVAAQPAGVAPVPGSVAAAAPSQKIEITTDLVRATIDTRGAGLVGLSLPRYLDEHDASKPVVLFDQSVDASDAKFAVPVIRHGLIRKANLPVAVTTATGTVGQFTFVGSDA